jgi:hypothetical protein
MLPDHNTGECGARYFDGKTGTTRRIPDVDLITSRLPGIPPWLTRLAGLPRSTKATTAAPALRPGDVIEKCDYHQNSAITIYPKQALCRLGMAHFRGRKTEDRRQNRSEDKAPAGPRQPAFRLLNSGFWYMASCLRRNKKNIGDTFPADLCLQSLPSFHRSAPYPP